MTSEAFLRPRLNGKRFEGGAIPLEVLGDFAVLEEMLVEVAKWKYRESNSGRKRVSRGFADGISLKLVGVETGSAIPVIHLALAAATLLPSPVMFYWQEARDAMVRAIAAAEQGRPITDHLPKELLGYFDRFGRSLEEGESIEFTENHSTVSAKLTKETRRKLVLASSADEVTEEVTVRGLVPEIDQRAKTFQILTADGTTLTRVPFSDQHYNALLEAFNGYKSNVRVLLAGAGRFSRTNRLSGIESIEHISVLDPLDIDARIEELKQLKPGWLNGEGVAPAIAGLDWLAGAFGRFLPDDARLPYLYPTTLGGVRAEWPNGSNELSLEIDLATKSSFWHSLNVDDDTEQAKELDLNDAKDWDWLVGEVRRLGGKIP